MVRLVEEHMACTILFKIAMWLAEIHFEDECFSNVSGHVVFFKTLKVITYLQTGNTDFSYSNCFLTAVETQEVVNF